jgi:Flp pilus assembly protein TadB
MSNTSSLQNNVDNYTMTSYFLNTYNEVAGTNSYLYNKNAIEKERLEKRLNRLQSVLLKMKQEFMLKQRATEDLQFGINVLQVVVITLCLILVLIVMVYQGHVGTSVAWTVVVAVFTIFIIIVFLLAKGNNTRHQDNWNKFYFGPMPTA